MLYYSLLREGINISICLCRVRATETGGWGVGITETRKPFILKRCEENVIHLNVLTLKKSLHWQMIEYSIVADICSKAEFRNLIMEKNINYLGAAS